MKLPLKILEKKEKIEYFLSLVLQEEKTTSVIFEKQGSIIKYISSDEEYFKDTIENASDNEFLDILDKVITTAEAPLPKNVETHKTLFGLKDSWIENDRIKKEYLDKLKNASSELSLEPIGFLAFSESLINLMQKEEGAPITAVLINVGKKYLTVYWVRGGKILETKTSEIHESASYTADALLKHFQTTGSLPTKIVLFNSDEDELAQEFIGHKWSKSLPFLHIPQIVNLPEDATTKAMLLGASTQMGTQLIYDYSKNLEDKVETPFVENTTEKEQEASSSAEEVIDSFEENEEEKHINSSEPPIDFFGFLEGVDVTKTAPTITTPEINPINEMNENLIQEIPNEIKEEEERKIPISVNANLAMIKIKSFSTKILPYVRKIKLNKNLLFTLKSKNKLLLIIPVILLILILGIFYTYFFNRSVQVNVFVNPKQEQKEISVTFSSVTNVADKTLAFETISVSENGTTTTKSTGKKYIGDKAKGIVTVFNNRSSAASLPAGTTITSSNNLEYETDKAISIASASGDIFSGTKPGTTDVAITASDIGQDYNLPSGTKFSIGSNSDIAAKNDAAFSGGTKKSITIVSQEDLDKLLSQLPKSLEQKARDDLKTKATDGKTIIPQFISEDVTNKSFDKKEGDQASSITLKGNVDFEAISYINQDMADLATIIFSTEEQIIPSNLQIQATNIKQQKNQDLTADLTIKASLMPKIDIESLRRQLAGNSKQKATNTLSNLPQTQDITFSFNPNIPLLPNNLPGDYKKIFINVSSK